MLRTLLSTVAIASIANAHFTLNWPETAGFIDDTEPDAPCGGATPIVNDTAPEVQIGRFAIAIFSTHPAGNWSFLATTNTAAPYNFQQFAAVESTGAGDFCLTEFSLPDNFAGTSGVIQVIDNSVDGTLYQCAPVRFVTGSNSTQGPTCSNNTGFSAEFSSTSTGNLSETPSASADASTSSSTGAAAMATAMGSVLGLGLLAAGLAL